MEQEMQAPAADSPPLLEVEDLAVWFPKDTSFWGRPLSWIKAVDGVSLRVQRGETLGVVGESGSGKSTTGFAVLRALKPTRGAIRFSPDGRQAHDLARLDHRQLRPLRRHLQLIFQDPFSSLNPRMTVQQLIAEPLLVNGVGTRAEQRGRVRELLAEVGLKPEYMTRYPHAFSGGQRQRIVIARALALQPQLIVCDEPVSALDVSVQAQILNLMLDLKERYGLAYVFIAHDLEVVRHICDRVVVMYAGRLVETGPTRRIFDRPLHPYTRVLLNSSPKPDPHQRLQAAVVRGEVPDPSNLPPGCVFHPRCPEAMDCCRSVVPGETRVGECTVRCLLHQPGYAPAAAG